MARSQEAGNTTVTAENPLTDLLAAPLSPGWTIEGLAEQVLSTIASQPKEQAKDLLLDAAATTDRQSQRVLRPLIACLATKSAAEAGRSPNLYGGQLSFKRIGPYGPVWILCDFENKAESARVVPPEQLPAADSGIGRRTDLRQKRSRSGAGQSFVDWRSDERGSRRQTGKREIGNRDIPVFGKLVVDHSLKLCFAIGARRDSTKGPVRYGSRRSPIFVATCAIRGRAHPVCTVADAGLMA